MYELTWMEEKLTPSGGLGEALSAEHASGGGTEPSRWRVEGVGAENDAIALAAEQLRRVQTGYSGPAWLAEPWWDGIYVVGMLAGAWNGVVITPRRKPVRATEHSIIAASDRAPPCSPSPVSCGRW